MASPVFASPQLAYYFHLRFFMTKLSPDAQAIWDAFNGDNLAAALRAAISILAEDYTFERESFKGEHLLRLELIDADDLRSIADELEGWGSNG